MLTEGPPNDSLTGGPLSASLTASLPGGQLSLTASLTASLPGGQLP